jgi:hypothetical protein
MGPSKSSTYFTAFSTSFLHPIDAGSRAGGVQGRVGNMPAAVQGKVVISKVQVAAAGNGQRHEVPAAAPFA